MSLVLFFLNSFKVFFHLSFCGVQTLETFFFCCNFKLIGTAPDELVHITIADKTQIHSLHCCQKGTVSRDRHVNKKISIYFAFVGIY